MSLDDAYNRALESVANLDPCGAASNSAVGFDGKVFTVPSFDRNYNISLPGFEVYEVGSGVKPPKILEILLLHYLARADGTPLSGVWIGYRQLPGAQLFEQRFANLVTRPLIELFDGDAEIFSASAQAIGGQPLVRMGDAGFRFSALPRVPMACVLYRGEEGIPPSINVLFDRTASHYLETEDLTILASLMNSYLKRARVNE